MSRPSLPEGAALAQAARKALAGFCERLALHADDVSAALAQELHLVAWDREQLIGSVQARLDAIAVGRGALAGGLPARVCEWRAQPLEAVDAVWSLLVDGRRVAYEAEAGACSATAMLLAEASADLPPGALTLRSEPAVCDGTLSPAPSSSQRAADIDPNDPSTWPRAGVARAVPRVAWVDAAADAELVAYVLARTCLRRSGTDPRAVHVAYVVGDAPRLQRQLQRLWVAAQLGPASDPGSFAGPVDASLRDAFEVAQAAWRAEPRARVWCDGGELERGEGGEIYLAPAAFCASWPLPEHPLVGPMCCVVPCTAEQATSAANAAAAAGASIVQVGGRPGTLRGDVRHIRGAVLVERLPPGLPEPRPA